MKLVLSCRAPLIAANDPAAPATPCDTPGTYSASSVKSRPLQRHVIDFVIGHYLPCDHAVLGVQGRCLGGYGHRFARRPTISGTFARSVCPVSRTIPVCL